MKSCKQTITAHHFILASYDQYAISIISMPPNRIFTIQHGIFPNRQNASPNSLGIIGNIPPRLLGRPGLVVAESRFDASRSLALHQIR